MFENSSCIMKMDPIEAVRSLQSQAYDPDQFGSLDSYMEWLASSVWRFRGIGINVTGETLEARCASLVAQLRNKNLI